MSMLTRISRWSTATGTPSTGSVFVSNDLLFTGVNVCFEMILFSYYIDMKDRDSQSSTVRGSMFQ